MRFINILKRVDAYPKTSEEVSVKTLIGATVTIISCTLIIFLAFSEFCEYASPSIVEELFVDTSRKETLRINLDLRVHSIGCNFLSLDAMDASGDQHLRIEQNIFKTRLNLNGSPIQKETPIKEIVQTSAKNSFNETCGSCYGAEHNKTHCCNSCEEVMNAYIAKKWSVQIDKIEQCKGNSEKFLKEPNPIDEGCQIKGFIEVNRMSGSFHIAPGASFSISQFHVHDFRYTDIKLAHTINHLSFGEKLGEFANTHPLDGLEVNSKRDGKSQMYNYYIKIVPTMYKKNHTHIINTNQFSVTRHKKVLNDNEKGMPGLFFSYEFSPLMVKYSEEKS
ncbi:endoplasmic reticulum-Golgi intermediate compartment protein 3 isoform X2 [Condylostylus longicornis]|uniref:endoplasmic reticulum-Golgi intermediate compartment protein 3 isoform X2 n=1 Tax=Condylostylus longicornis TaxID=2530218 RepID=UPI00244E3E58|nr:endoplasmic reticulum-Golgi intermediate compartment protein 3 isoform X2 [Condylostylus longicornis]